MKKEIDKDGRILYKFSHSTSKGGNVYVHKTISGKNIENKEGLRNYLEDISNKYKLIDPVVKIYDNIFFLFFHLPKSLAPAEIIDRIPREILPFGVWDEDSVFTAVYDLQEKFLRKDLEKWGYEYEKG